MARGEDHPKGRAGETSSLITQPARDLSGMVLGDFQVERMLGQGGMGEVYLARQVSLDRPVALKVLKPEWAKNPAYMARFEAEALAAAKLNHPNIVHIYSLGGVDDIRFIAMEYVQGTNLREYLTKKGVPDLPLALAIMRQAGLAVGAAGEAGLTHRDIKPENLLLTRKGQVKVADFGLAQLPEGDRLHLTAPGMTLGTPMYMSPEQVQGQTVDHRSDLYSLGVTFYHMLCGSPPFHAETAVALALKHVREMPVDLATRRSELPAGLSALVMKLMAKSPDDRYQSSADMLRDLSKIKESMVTVSMPISPVEESAEPEDDEDEEELEEREPSWRPSAFSMTLVGIPMLIVGALLGWLGRTEDLLSSSSPTADSLPAIWMANWNLVPKKPTAELQYRFAQLHSSDLDREAAWLAVPGNFPKSPDEALAAYTQLARLYLRRGDVGRLEALSLAIKEVEQEGEEAREKWLNVSRVAHAGSVALKGNAKEVGAIFAKLGNLSLLDPALAELSLEVVGRAAASGDVARGVIPQLREQLLKPLGLIPALLSTPNSSVPPSGG